MLGEGLVSVSEWGVGMSVGSSERRRVSRRVPSRPLVVLVLALSALFAGCSTTRVAVSHPCPGSPANAKTVAASNRGAIGLAKVGLTPKRLKADEKCS
jgi:hypothetical protein